MARPPKKGLDYFPLDCHSDTKTKLVEANFGLLGFAITVRLWQQIYADEGYYMVWDEDTGLLFSKDNNIEPKLASDVVDECIKRGIFDQEKFQKYSILTSKGIQERYLTMTEKRTGIKILDEYAVLNAPSELVSAEKTGVSSPKTKVSDGRKYTKESKRKEIKEKETKRNKNKTNNSPLIKKGDEPEWYYAELEKQERREQEQRSLYECSLFDLFESELARTISSSECQRLAEWSEQYDDQLIRYALRESLIQGKRNFDYIDRILMNWEKAGFTAEQYENGEFCEAKYEHEYESNESCETE